MKFAEALKLIINIEEVVNTEEFTWKGFHTWPLIRKILWLKLITTNYNSEVVQKENKISFLLHIKKFTLYLLNSFKKTKIKKDSRVIFFSRPSYLQKMYSGRYFDRIVDPIIESFEINEKVTKYYSEKISKEKVLIHSSFHLYQNSPLMMIKIPKQQKKLLDDIAKLLDINSLELQQSFSKDLQLFVGWYDSAKELLKKHLNLKEIYIGCWYFPDTMGVCAAADELSIKTIDVQHGKQGKYQAMYSGWTKLPKNGYALMPDSFWCWGQPSCEHILASSPNRKKHIPFIGGYPWIEYYKKNMLPLDSKNSSSKIRVLLTMQTPQAGNLERIPDFIIDFLSSSTIEDVHFIFRYHPNDIYGYHYCKERLVLIDPSLYSIDSGTQNLYDVFRVVTHHITAYSSCCYEASLFNIPTLLYGEESKEIYEDDINNDIFTWINSNEESLRAWLHSDSNDKPNTAISYIDNVKYDT